MKICVREERRGEMSVQRIYDRGKNGEGEGGGRAILRYPAWNQLYLMSFSSYHFPKKGTKKVGGGGHGGIY
jgi:hypothetical protein